MCVSVLQDLLAHTKLQKMHRAFQVVGWPKRCECKMSILEGHTEVTDGAGPEPDQLYIIAIGLCRPQLDEIQADGRRCE